MAMRQAFCGQHLIAGQLLSSASRMCLTSAAQEHANSEVTSKSAMLFGELVEGTSPGPTAMAVMPALVELLQKVRGRCLAGILLDSKGQHTSRHGRSNVTQPMYQLLEGIPGCLPSAQLEVSGITGMSKPPALPSRGMDILQCSKAEGGG